MPIDPRRGEGSFRRFTSNFSGDADAADTEKSDAVSSKSAASCPGMAAAIAAAEAGARGGCCCCVACSACCWASGELPDCILYYCGLMPWAGMTGCATIPKSKYPRESEDYNQHPMEYEMRVSHHVSCSMQTIVNVQREDEPFCFVELL